MKFRLSCGLLVWLLAATLPADETKKYEFFEKKIRPVLVKHCYECHSQAAAKENKLQANLLLDSRQGVRAGGDSGPAVVPGKPEESWLLSALRYDLFEMPPQGKLPEAVAADFEKWIKNGAPDPRDDPSAVRREGIDLAAGRKHWAYQLPQWPEQPSVQDTSWPRNEIDFFILRKLEAKGWSPAKDAEPEVLVRRLYYDLTGLPPRPEEIERFVADPSPEAYRELVDRLLDSPRFGERWGRHWLDVVRFAESNTLRGTVFGEAWRYRDWVIDAFNRDLPFNEFVVQQIAGDLLPAESREQRKHQLTATAFLALGNTNFENQDKEQLRMDVVDEQLEVIGRAFLGQTIACARCHDHKFDPIPTKDYYALAGILRNTKTLVHSNVSRWVEVPLPADPETEAKLKQHQAEVKQLQDQIAQAKRKLPNRTQASGAKSVRLAELPGLVLDNLQAKKQGDWADSTHTPRFVEKGYLHDANGSKGQKSVTFDAQLPSGEYEVRISYSHGTNRASNTPVTVHFVDEQTKTIRVNQRKLPPIDDLFVSLGTFEFNENLPARVVISNKGTDGHVIVDAVQFLTPAEAKEAESDLEKSSKAEEFAKLRSQVKQWENELKQLQKSAPQRPMVMSVQEEKSIGDTKVHIRGNVHNLGPDVPRGFLQVALYEDMPDFTNDESGRRQLGQWLASEKNPLTARVTVNRFWHWLFGTGIVRTTDNFGTVGEEPSHPELLDYLALQFQRDGWSIKKTLRRIVLSRTYQMSSRPGSSAAAKQDPENRLLSHTNRRRLEAECIRDTMLAVSGELDLTMYGPSFPTGRKADYGFRYDGNRRSVYVPIFRNALPEIFEVFDFANPSMVVGDRATSTVAPQALFLMNNPWVLEQSQHAAKRLLQEMPEADDLRRVDRAYRLTLGRSPTQREAQLTLQFVQNASEEQPVEVWAELFQTLFASIDFRYVD